MKRNQYHVVDFGEAVFRYVVAAAVAFWAAYYIGSTLVT